MKAVKFTIVFLLSFLFSANVYGGNAYEKKSKLARLDSIRESKPLKVNLGINIMSSYICRGAYQTGASIQPKFSLNYKGLVFEAWGSTDFVSSDMQEVDLTLGYQYKGLRIVFTDYYVSGRPISWGEVLPGGNPLRTYRNYFEFNSHETSHVVGPMISWRITEKVPITVSWETLLWGRDYENYGDGDYSNDKRQYTSYFQVSYPFQILKYVDCEAGVGGIPWSSELFGTDGFSITNIYLNTEKIWKLDFGLRLGLYVRASYNPEFDQLNFVGGLHVGL